MVSSCARARIALPTSDYNNLDNAKPDATEQLDTPDSEPVVAASEDVSGLLFPWTMGVVRVMRKVYLECRDEDLSSCLKVQMVRAMDRVARSTKKVALATGITLERDADSHVDDKALSKDDLESTLPRSLPERERSLDKLIMDRLYSFLQNYSLRFKLPSMTELSVASEDGKCPGLKGLILWLVKTAPDSILEGELK